LKGFIGAEMKKVAVIINKKYSLNIMLVVVPAEHYEKGFLVKTGNPFS